MITFIEGEAKIRNATVTLGELEHDAYAARDAEGNIEVTLDVEAPTGGVTLVLHKEGDATYKGWIAVREGKHVFTK